MVNVFLLLGSNLGNREMFFKNAIDAIEKSIALVTDKSSVYETQSWGKTDQPDYLNQVVMIKTNLDAREILTRILTIEKSLGRERTEKWGPRTIDIDILFYGDSIINEPELTVPHPELHNRGFTLAPLAEIVPDLVHPVLKKSIMQLKNELTDTLNIKKL